MKNKAEQFCAGLIIAGLFCGSAGVAQTNRAVMPVPPLLTLRSPVETFRTLLVMPAAERARQLASRPPEIRQKLTEKVREYQSLSAEEQQLRLTATELRWYLKPLLVLAPTNRAARLATIPTNMVEMVQARLKLWDQLAPRVQSLMLTNEHGAAYVAFGSAGNFYPPLPSDKTRRKVQDRFEQIFEFTPSEKARVLSSLSEAEQKQMQKTLEAFDKLTPAQRVQCVRSFAKFSGMSAVERQEFLKNAVRWAQMTPAERQSWRELVSVAPQMPPLPILNPRLPPLPAVLPKAPAVTANGG